MGIFNQFIGVFLILFTSTVSLAFDASSKKCKNLFLDEGAFEFIAQSEDYPLSRLPAVGNTMSRASLRLTSVILEKNMREQDRIDLIIESLDIHTRSQHSDIVAKGKKSASYFAHDSATGSLLYISENGPRETAVMHRGGVLSDRPSQSFQWTIYTSSGQVYTSKMQKGHNYRISKSPLRRSLETLERKEIWEHKDIREKPRVLQVEYLHPYFEHHLNASEGKLASVLLPPTKEEMDIINELSAEMKTTIIFSAVLPNGYTYSKAFKNGRDITADIEKLFSSLPRL